jgi:hypothetical protein
MHPLLFLMVVMKPRHDARMNCILAMRFKTPFMGYMPMSHTELASSVLEGLDRQFGIDATVRTIDRSVYLGTLDHWISAIRDQRTLKSSEMQALVLWQRQELVTRTWDQGLQLAGVRGNGQH